MWSLADLRSMAASSARGCCAWSAHTDRILSAVRKVVSACDELWWESWSAGCADCEKAEADRKEPHRPGAGKAEVMVGGGTDDGDVVAGAPARRLRPRWPSLSRWPTTGAMPARRLISLRMVGVTPRLWRKTMPQLLLAAVGVVVAIAASTEARSTDTPLNRSAWATWAARMWPLKGCGNRKDCLPGHGCRAAKFGLLGREQPGRNRQAPAQRPGEGVTLQGWLQHRHDFARYLPAPYRRLA